VAVFLENTIGKNGSDLALENTQMGTLMDSDKR
jgi:hypothetical protein